MILSLVTLCYSNYYTGLALICMLVLYNVFCVQDTVIAMKALSGFAQDTFTRELNKRITFDVPGLSADAVSITPDNRYQRTTVNVSRECVCLIKHKNINQPSYSCCVWMHACMHTHVLSM